jgi:unsaturated chondroitin disaccharide hydrolase
MTYRESGKAEFLQLAEKIADFILGHPNMPKDLVPYWDFDVPSDSGEPRDVSAAAITASALYELGSFIPAKKKLYQEKASLMLASIADNYMSPSGGNKGFILGHSTGHKPNNSEVDVPIMYADYYFLEAVNRINKNSQSEKNLE